MNTRARFCTPLLASALLLLAPDPAQAQEKFLKGQNVAPVFEGWQRAADGTIVMHFGYLNRNYEEILDIPIGPNNYFEPGPDRGQPTHFLTRRHRFLFQVVLPKDWARDRRMVWTLTVNGKTERAQGWLQPEWEVDEGVIQMNIGPGGAPPADPPNTAPVITGSPAQAATTAAPITVTARASDDGVPKPRPSPPGAASRAPQGLWIRWVHYRGAGQVTFSAPASERGAGAPVEAPTRVTFGAPGTYVLRAIASDGLLESAHDVTVNVKQ